MKIGLAALAAAAALAASSVAADELQTYTVVLKGRKFMPAEVHVPSAKPFWLVIVNQDDTADEFEMSAPPLEKVVQPGDQGRVRVRPLAPGKFTFFDDFHPDTKGAIVAE